MKTLIYIFIAINIGAALFLLFAILSNDQDAAGKNMAFLPILLLIACGIGSYFLMQNNHLTLAMILSGFPVLILGYLLFISFT